MKLAHTEARAYWAENLIELIILFVMNFGILTVVNRNANHDGPDLTFIQDFPE